MKFEGQNIDLIRNRINRYRIGYPFTPSDFYDIVSSPSVVSRILNKMVCDGEIRKLSKGRFDKPKQSEFGVLPPSDDWLVREFLYKGKTTIGYITGTRAFARIGLTTQISSNYQIGTNTYRRAITRGENKISFVLQPNVITKNNIPLLQLLDAVRFIRQIPATTPDAAIMVIKNTISTLSFKGRKDLVRLALAYTSSVRAVVGALLEEMGGDICQLQKSLNVASTYKLGISANILPYAKKWRIV